MGEVPIIDVFQLFPEKMICALPVLIGAMAEISSKSPTAFASFILSGVTSIKMLGFGVAFAIILDATLVRALLVPALMRLFGERNWWAPKSMKRFTLDH